MSNSTLPTSDLPEMSTSETLTNIFFEPGRTFEALRARPRFLVAALIITALTTLFTILFFEKVNFEQFMRDQIENSPRTAQMTREQKDQAIRTQTSPIVKGISYVSPVIGLTIFIAAGAALYMLGAMLMGGPMSYKQALSVWTYSSYAPGILAMMASMLLLFLKPREDIDLARGAGGLLQANLGLLVGNDASPMLASILRSFDIFSFFGLFLAVIGLRKVARLSSGAAWAVALGIWLLGILAKVVWAAVFGQAI